jgi:hypothetical protein
VVAGYLQNVVGTVSLVLDLHITHERWGTAADKIRKYRADYNQNPPIGKLTVFLQIQESSLHNTIVEVSTTAVWYSPV